MADFKQAFQLTNKLEGRYSNNSADTGGETYAGISRKNFPFWSAWTFIDELKKQANFASYVNSDDVASLMSDYVQAFYKENFWNPLLLDQVKHQGVANELYDTAVNMGQGIAAKFLQRSLNALNRNGVNLVVDGKMGTATVAILNAFPNPDFVLKLINCLQGARYVDITEANPKQKEFMNGWIGRI